MATSGTFNFGFPKSQVLIDDAFERIGALPSFVTEQKIVAAQRSLNFIMQEWVNKGNNLWTIKHGIIGLNTNQAAYPLPLGAIDIKTATLRTSNRLLGGTPFSSNGGNAQFAFDNNPQTACTQTSPNGYISYNWGLAQNVTAMVGVQSAVTVDYSLVVEYSFDGATWLNSITIPKQTYSQNILQWYPIPIPIPANQIRIQETGGATLNIEELYFNNALQDTMVSRFSEFEYTAFPNKALLGRPSGFWVDRQINPILYLYPVPNGLYTALYFTYWRAIEDVGTMLDSAEIPARFLEPLTAVLAYKLAIKYASELGISDTQVDRLGMLADKAYVVAGSEDRERVPTRFYASPGFTRMGGY